MASMAPTVVAAASRMARNSRVPLLRRLAHARSTTAAALPLPPAAAPARSALAPPRGPPAAFRSSAPPRRPLSYQPPPGGYQPYTPLPPPPPLGEEGAERLPLLFWALALTSLGFWGSSSYYLVTNDWEKMMRRGGTGAWGARVHLDALQELNEWLEYALVMSNVEMVPKMLDAGLLRCIYSGLRSDDHQVRTAAWGLAAELSRSPVYAVQLLEFKDEGGGGGGDLWDQLVRDLYASVEQTRAGSATASGTQPVQGPTIPTDLAAKLGLGLGAVSPLPPNAAAGTDDGGGGGGGGGAFAGETYSFSIDHAQLSPLLITAVNLTQPAWKLHDARSNSKKRGISPLAAVGTEQVADPRFMWSCIELLAQLHPEHLFQADLLAELDDDAEAAGGEGGDVGGGGGDGKVRPGAGFGSPGMGGGSNRGKMFPIKSHYSAEGGYHAGNPMTDNLDSVERGLMLVMELDCEVRPRGCGLV